MGPFAALRWTGFSFALDIAPVLRVHEEFQVPEIGRRNNGGVGGLCGNSNDRLRGKNHVSVQRGVVRCLSAAPSCRSPEAAACRVVSVVIGT